MTHGGVNKWLKIAIFETYCEKRPWIGLTCCVNDTVWAKQLFSKFLEKNDDSLWGLKWLKMRNDVTYISLCENFGSNDCVNASHRCFGLNG